LPRSWTTPLFPRCRISFSFLSFLFSPRFRTAANVRPPRVINCRQNRRSPRQEPRGIIQKRRGGEIRANRLSVRPCFYALGASASCVLRARLTTRCPFFIFGKRGAPRDFSGTRGLVGVNRKRRRRYHAAACIRGASTSLRGRAEGGRIKSPISREICARATCKCRRLDRKHPSRMRSISR